MARDVGLVLPTLEAIRERKHACRKPAQRRAHVPACEAGTVLQRTLSLRASGVAGQEFPYRRGIFARVGYRIRSSFSCSGPMSGCSFSIIFNTLGPDFISSNSSRFSHGFPRSPLVKSKTVSPTARSDGLDLLRDPKAQHYDDQATDGENQAEPSRAGP